MEDPLHLSRAYIVATHVAGRHFLCKTQVIDDGSQHDGVAAHSGWRFHVVIPASDLATEALHQVDITVLTKIT